MAGLTDEGLVIKTLPEIYTSMGDKLKANYGSSFSTASNTPEGVIIGIVSDELDDVWQGALALYSSFSPKTASSTNLDGACDAANVKRLEASKTIAQIRFTGVVNTIVPTGTALSLTDSTTKFFTVESLTLADNEFNQVIVEVDTVLDSTNYTVTIDGNAYTINSGVGATALSIATALAAALNSETSCTTTLVGSTVSIKVKQDVEVLPLIVGVRLSITSISNIVAASPSNTGGIIAPAGTLSSLLIPVSGITAVVNPLDAAVGRDRETDQALRVRRYNSVQAPSRTNKNSLLAAVNGLNGVTYSNLLINSGVSTDSNGVRSKAFELVVLGGDVDEIATAVYEHTPVGIECQGDIARTVYDEDGSPVAINFSRPSGIFIHVLCQYKRYSEEGATQSLQNTIKSSILKTGSSLTVGKDVIPSRFLGDIYSSTSGVGEVTILMAKSLDGVTLLSPLSSSLLPIGGKEIVTFRDDLIVVQEIV